MRPGLDCLLIEFEDPAVPSMIEKTLEGFSTSGNLWNHPTKSSGFRFVMTLSLELT